MSALGKPMILGAATSAFGRFPERTVEQLAWDAVGAVLTQAGLEPGQIEAVFVGNVFGPAGVAARVVRSSGVHGVPVTRVEAACASGTLAAHLAAQAVAEGRYRYVLALGIEQMSTLFDGAIVPERTDPEGSLGLALPGLYALTAQRYLHVHRRDVADLAAVAVKNRAHGVLNPLAQRQSAVTLDEVLSSRAIADPLTVLQCCPVSDGAAAAVFGPVGSPGGVRVEASAAVGGEAWPGTVDEVWGAACVRRATGQALAQTDRVMAEADLFEVHDAFTIGELMTVESLGLCTPGEAPLLLADGVFHAGGRWPVNVSGGLLSRGHALGATGLAQLAEAYAQLTGTAGERQLADPSLAVVETMGGGASGLDGNAAVVMMLAT